MLKKKICLIFVFFVFIFCFKIASAEVVINEVQISPTEERFIELYNSSSSSVDLTNWYIQRKTVSGADFGSLVSKTYFVNKSIGAGSYFLISKNELGLSSLTLTESNTIQLKNSEQQVVDKIGWGEGESGVAENPPEGKSIQKFSFGWNIAFPTPGAINQESSGSGEEENNIEDNNDGETTSTPVSSHSSNSTPKPKIIPTFKANILAPTLAFAGQPIEFNLNIKYGEETYACGKYFWNFGDGDSKHTEGGFEKFTHTFYYPGEYNVSLEYFEKKDSALPAITDDMVIKVVPMTVSISNVGDFKDFFIEISNNANSKINISNWILSSDNKKFILPKNTVVAGSSSTIISGKISGFTIADKSSLKLSMPDGEVVFDYNSKSVSTKRVESESYENYSNNENEEYGEENNNSNFYENQANSKNKKDLTSASIFSGQENILSEYGFILSLLVLLCVSAGVVYFIRRKNHNVVGSTDFDIVDE